MSRAGNAGIVATDDLFTGQRHLLIGKMQQAWHELAQVLFDTRLVLRGRWNDLGFTNHAITIYLVPMIENPSRRFRTSHTGTRSNSDRQRRQGWRFVAFDEPQRFF